MTITDVAWAELFSDEELAPDFDPARRWEPPWFGWAPRVLAFDLARPFHPEYALWREGRIVEVARLGVDRRGVAGELRALLLLAEDFADLCRERELFGAHYISSAPGDDAARAAAAALLAREADWCGMFVGEAAPRRKEWGVAAAVTLAEARARALAAGDATPEPLVARRRAIKPRSPDGDGPN